jgi:hypothetical protein
MLRQFKISTAILLMATGATIALVLLPQYPHWLSSRVETAQTWVDDIWPQTLKTSNELAKWSVTDIGPGSEEIVSMATEDHILGISASYDLKFSIDVYPNKVIPDVPYILSLSSKDGVQLARTIVSWIEPELDDTGIRSRNLSEIQASEKLKTKGVVLEINHNDISIPAFIEEYNREAKEIVRRYDKDYFEYCEITLDAGVLGGADIQVGNLECVSGGWTPGLLEFPEERSNAIISRHYTIEFNAPDQYQGKPVTRTD